VNSSQAFAKWRSNSTTAFDNILFSPPFQLGQILRLGLMLLNHQNRIAATTTTKRIVSFICAL